MATFTIETKGAGQGALSLTIEGPSEAKMTCRDNRDGSCQVEYMPTKSGAYYIHYVMLLVLYELILCNVQECMFTRFNLACRYLRDRGQVRGQADPGQSILGAHPRSRRLEPRAGVRPGH